MAVFIRALADIVGFVAQHLKENDSIACPTFVKVVMASQMRYVSNKSRPSQQAVMHSNLVPSTSRHGDCILLPDAISSTFNSIPAGNM